MKLYAQKYLDDLKKKVENEIAAYNKYLQPYYSLISLATETSIISTPINFIKYSFGYIIFGVAYVLSNLVDCIIFFFRGITGVFISYEEENNNNGTTFINNSTEYGL